MEHKYAPYNSIRLVAKAGMLACPSNNNLPCGLCEYGTFCSALVKAFNEAKKLSETDEHIAKIINQEYEDKILRDKGAN